MSTTSAIFLKNWEEVFISGISGITPTLTGWKILFTLNLRNPRNPQEKTFSTEISPFPPVFALYSRLNDFFPSPVIEKRYALSLSSKTSEAFSLTSTIASGKNPVFSAVTVTFRVLCFLTYASQLKFIFMRSLAYTAIITEITGAKIMNTMRIIPISPSM